jgi:hypothetical protein
MKTFFISAGLVAAGAAGMQSVFADDSIPAPSPKIWSVSATLRGFYDDNYSTANTKKGSFGIELTPSASINASLPQTDIGFRYTYGLYWYQERQILGQNAIDQTHQVDFWLDHAFNERWKTTVSDTLAVGQEPELLNPSGGGNPVPFRVNGNNLGNHFNATLDTQWTRQFSTSLHYQNDFYDYQNTGWDPTTDTASLAGLLNRVDQNIGFDLQWHFQPETMAFVGYSFDWVNYTSDELISAPPYNYHSDSRNSYTHQVHVGLQHQFTANLGGTISAGAQYTDSYNDPLDNSGSWSPYANISLNYTYLPGSYVQVGFSQNVNSTYVAQVASNGSLTQYQESSTIFGSVNHRFTEKLLGSAIAQYIYSDFHDGGSLGPDVQYSLGLNLSYQFNHYLSADIGYNYDKLRSDVIGSAYERNRYYIGLTATY